MKCNIICLLTLLVSFSSLSGQIDTTSIKSAFFGLDNSLPFPINVICPGGANMDGMPLNFNYPIDGSTLEKDDFEVIDQLGNSHTPLCATLNPASENGEHRTVLLIGEFGNAGTNPPVEVRVIGDLFTLETSSEQATCNQVLNLNGAFTKHIVSLNEGPTLFFAQQIEGSISECPTGTSQVIQVAWNGGITPMDDLILESELFQYYTVFSENSGVLIPHTPTSIADINDNDNFHQLCLNTSDSIVKVSFPENILVDPNHDLNPFSEIELSYCADLSTSHPSIIPDKPKLVILPNPADSYFKLGSKALKGSILIRIMSLSGKILLEQKFDEVESLDTTLNISYFSSGIYMVYCKHEKGIITSKLVVEKLK